MVLEGLHAAAIIGWGLGAFYLTRPWDGHLRFTWCSYHTLYSLLYNTYSIIVLVDFTLQGIQYLKFQSLVSKILNLSLLIGGVLFGIFFRLLFLLRARSICNFLSDLKHTAKTVEADLGLSWGRYKFYIYFCILWSFFNAALIPIGLVHLMPNGSHLGFLPAPYCYINLYFFGTLASIVTIQLAFVFVVTTTFHLLFAIERLFVDFEEQVAIKTKIGNGNHGDNVTNATTITRTLPLNLVAIMESPSILGKNGSESRSSIESISMSKIERSQSQSALGREMSSEEMIARILHIKNLCFHFERVVGPFYLLLIVRIVFFLIHSADTVLIDGVRNLDAFALFKLIFSWVHILYEISQLVLIFLGHLFHKRVISRKDQLLKQIFIAPPSPGKDEMHQVWEILQVWNWKITAYGIFVVDKPLISGVVTSMMSYVVILFQVNLSDVGNATNCTLTNYR